MHLGRFHATIYRLNNYYQEIEPIEKLNNLISHLQSFINTRNQEHLTVFKNTLEEILKIPDPEKNLAQPYAKQILNELKLLDDLGQPLASKIKTVITQNSFDQNQAITELTSIRDDLARKLNEIQKIDSAFTSLDVEYESVFSGDSEIGLLLPRELTGETLEELNQELQQINRVFRAINEITGSEEYSPKIRTISSSWWQIFLELDHTQIAAWVFAIERIVNLFKTNLEIKALQKQLEEKDIPKRITSALEKEVETKIKTGIQKIASDIRKKFSKTSDEPRLNELETQLKQGLTYLAKRLNQGAEIEINISLPAKPEKPKDSEENQEALAEYQNQLLAYEEKLKSALVIQSQAFIASQKTLEIEKDAPLAIKYDEEDNPKN
jgi:hypothetical protein